MDEKEFALRLAKLRTKKNVSAREMSLAIGQNSNYINHIETGRAIPSLCGVFYICEYLGITPAEFFETENTNPQKLNKIISNLKKLNDEQLDLIGKLTENLAKK